jgi:glutaminyl-peptide cyclotransferase
MIGKLLIIASLFILISCDNSSSPEYDPTLPQAKTNSLPAPAPLMFTVDAVYPHDQNSFTQGLEFHNGKLYEGTGELEQSRLRILDIKGGNVLKEYKIPDKTIFGEGITILHDKIYQLSWQNHKIFVYDIKDITHPVDTFTWSREGWGATNDGTNIIISDGTSQLFFVQPDAAGKKMKMNKILTVMDNRGVVDSLNELELINGYVYAKIWMTNNIVKIDTSNGHVVGLLNFTGLLQQYDRGVRVGDDAVLNGIAYDSVSQKMYITGKNWPKLFEMHLNK